MDPDNVFAVVAPAVAVAVKDAAAVVVVRLAPLKILNKLACMTRTRKKKVRDYPF